MEYARYETRITHGITSMLVVPTGTSAQKRRLTWNERDSAGYHETGILSRDCPASRPKRLVFSPYPGTLRLMDAPDEARILTSHSQGEDADLDVNLRPRRLTEYVGQKQIKENLQVFLDAAKKRKQPLDHVLLHGAPGFLEVLVLAGTHQQSR